MTPQEVLEYVASKVGGDASNARYGTEQKEVDLPLTPGERAKREARGESLKTKVTVEKWTTPGGQVIFEGYRDPNNSESFTALSQPPTKDERAPGTTTAASENDPPKEKDQGGRHYVWRANPPGQAGGQWEDVGPGPENAQERQARLDQESAARATATAAETARHNQVSEQQAAANAMANAQDIVTAQDGTKYILNKQTGQFTLMPGSNPKLPSGIGQFQPDPSKPGYGLFERRQMLLDLVSKGAITEAQMKEILAQDQAMATSLAGQATAVTNGANTAYDNLMTQRSQDITQAGQRLTSSNTQYNNALSFANQNAVGLARAGTTDIMGPLLRGMTLNATRSGGMETPDAVALPKALSRYLTMDLPGMGKWAPVGVTDQGPGATGAPDWNTVPYQGQDQSQAPAPVEAAPSQPSAAIDNMSPQKQGASLWDDDPEMQGHVSRVMGYAA